jgi:hypothetical protein
MPIDYSRYPPNWKSEIVHSVLRRASDRCECCNLLNKSIVYAITLDVKENGRYKQRSIWFTNENDAIRESHDYRDVRKIKVVLTIAHLDHDEENHNISIDRLQAMCQLCHLRYDSKEKYQRSLKKWAQPKLPLA